MVDLDVKLPPGGLIQNRFVKIEISRRRIGVRWLRIQIDDFLPDGINQVGSITLGTVKSVRLPWRVDVKRIENRV